VAHKQQMTFVASVKQRNPGFFYDKKVIEIGSLDINGSIRSLFQKCQYTGVDVAPGRGVDVVAQGHTVEQDLGKWDVVCSTEMFEHNPRWADTWRRMLDLVRPGGLVFFTCATEGRAEHGTSRTTPSDSPLTVGIGWEYYKNLTEADFRAEADLPAVFSDFEFTVEPSHRDIYFWGIKRARSRDC